jgi:hypothetical protein
MLTTVALTLAYLGILLFVPVDKRSTVIATTVGAAIGLLIVTIV